MNNKELDYMFFDQLVETNSRFALYRLPEEAKIHLIAQISTQKKQNRNTITDLDTKTGFIMAPFTPSPKNPICLIEPDINLCGEDQIRTFSQTFKIEKAAPRTPSTHSDNNQSDSKTRYEEKFHLFMSELQKEKLSKLVLSRTKTIDKTPKFSITKAFQKAQQKFPEHFVFLSHTPESGTWLGISPELLLSKQDQQGQTVALAGTRLPRNNNQAWDNKNIIEQKIVSEYMEQQLSTFGSPHTQSQVKTIKSGNIEHLKTTFNFSFNNQPKQMGTLLNLLHPSPAICGFPKKEAYNFINTNEGYNRDYYSGFIGPININNNSKLFVNLRCMKVTDHKLRLYAGGGLTLSSQCQDEWTETENKMQAILTILD